MGPGERLQVEIANRTPGEAPELKVYQIGSRNAHGITVEAGELKRRELLALGDDVSR